MERVDLDSERHALRQRWRNGDEWDEAAAKVEVGELVAQAPEPDEQAEDGDLPEVRWYTRKYAGGRRGSDERIGRAYSGPNAEHYARATARRWMRTIGGEWVEA